MSATSFQTISGAARTSIEAEPCCGNWVTSGAARDVLGVALGEGAQLRIGLEPRLELLPRLLALGREVLGRPVTLVRAVTLEHVAGDGRLVHFVDTIGDSHRGCGGVHRL